MLLSIVILRVNTGNLNTHEVLIDSKVQILATSLANSIIEEAFTKEFDEYNVNYPAELLSNLTSVSDLGKDTGENYPNFDDMDDFNKIGYCEKWENIPDPAYSILSATDTSISFLTDLPSLSHPYGDGIIDTMKYFSSSVVN